LILILTGFFVRKRIMIVVKIRSNSRK